MIAVLRAALDGSLDLEAHPDPQAASGQLVLAGCAGAALFGAVTGSLYGDLQIVSSALKMPLVLLLPVVVTLPALHWLAAWHHPTTWNTAVRQAAVGIARTGLSLLMAVPVVWLAWWVQPGHGLAVQLVAGLVALAFASSARGDPGAAAWSRWASVALLALTLGQTCWILRPFVGSPDVSFRWLENPRGDFVQGVIDPMYQHPGEP